MNRLELDPQLERLGDALRAATTGDLAREQELARLASTGGGRQASGRATPSRWTPGRSRIFAGGTLGLAGVGAALAIVLGGAAASPASAKPRLSVTRQANGSVLVKVNTNSSSSWVSPADRKLAAMGINEQVLTTYKGGAPTANGVVDCRALKGAGAPSGPPIKVLFTQHGMPAPSAGNTGAGSTRVSGCAYFSPSQGDTGTTGAG